MSRFDGAKIRAIFGSRGFYIALVLCLTAAGIIGYNTLFRAEAPVEEVVNPTPVIDNTPVIPDPVEEIPVTEPEKDAPVMEEVPDVEDLLPQVISPLDGTTVTVFSMNELLYDETMADWRTHDGLDIQAAEGDAVKTAAAGTVVKVEDDELMGTTVFIQHAGGYTTQYSSLQADPPVREGQTVVAGDIIGTVGSTATAENNMGPHLHFSVSKDGKVIDPAEYVG
ncbi:MAG: M23 family metallopeptidase [Oscillospiraceae bacterium]|nr:M23 family metallopeptidase [Oscillospiraceae bacterium]